MKRKLALTALLFSQLLSSYSLLQPQVASAEARNTNITLYRMHNPKRNVYLYTKNPEEYNGLTEKGWRREGVAWYSASNQGEIVYRLYNPKTNTHLYTKNPQEYQTLPDKGWRKEGVAFRSYGDLPIYRLFNPKTKRHFYTRHMTEYQTLRQRGWHPEGIAFYGMTSLKAPVDPAELARAKKAVEEAQARVAGLEKDQKGQQQELQAAQTALQEAQTALEAKKEEWNNRLATLESDVETATIAARKKVYQSEPGQLEESHRHEEMSPTIFTTEETEWVELDATQKNDYQRTSTFTYKPNKAAINEHIATYLNEIKTLNNIPGIVRPSEGAMSYAVARLAELQNNDAQEDQSTSLAIDQYVEGGLAAKDNVMEFLFAPTYYPNLAFGSRARSDKEMAYYFVLGWFTEFHHAYLSEPDLNSRYQHVLRMLDGGGEIGFAMAYPEVTSAFGFDQSSAVFSRIETADDQAKSTLADFTLGQEGSTTALLYKGNRLKFPTKMTFQYGYTEESDSLVAARNALVAGKQAIEDEKARLQEQHQAAQTKRDQTQQTVDETSRTLQEAQAALTKAKEHLAHLQQ